MCGCDEKITTPKSYHFVCSYPIPKPWNEIRTPLYSESVHVCVKEIYHLWFRMIAKALNKNFVNTVDIGSPRRDNLLMPKIDRF